MYSFSNENGSSESETTDLLSSTILACSGKYAVGLVTLANLGQLRDSFDAENNSVIADAFHKRINAILRPEDDLIHIAPDNVCIVLDDLIDRNHLQLAALKIERLFAEAIDVCGRPLNMAVKCGLVYAGRHTRSSKPPTQIYQMAEEACCGGIMTGKNFEIVDAADDVQSDDDWQLNQRVQAAMQNHHIAFDYQPKIDLESGALKGGEALIRWRDLGRIVPPDEYLAALNDDVLWELTVYGYRRILREIIDFNLQIPIAYNIDPSALAHPDFLDFVRRETNLWGVPTSQIVFEITENEELVDLLASKKLLEDIRKLGFRISLDDFGSGHGNMHRIRELPLDEIKIDRSLCGQILENDDAAHITQNIIDLAKTLGMTSVAEGIEDAQTIEVLKEYGCDVGQGFYIGMPMSVEDFAKLNTTDE